MAECVRCKRFYGTAQNFGCCSVCVQTCRSERCEVRPVDPRVGFCASCTASRPNGAGPFYKQTAGTHHSCLRRGGVHGRPCLEPAADANTLCGICSMKTTLCRGVNTQFCPNRREDGSDLCNSCLRPRCKRAACAGTALEDGYCESHKTVALTHLLDDQDRLASKLRPEGTLVCTRTPGVYM